MATLASDLIAVDDHITFVECATKIKTIGFFFFTYFSGFSKNFIYIIRSVIV